MRYRAFISYSHADEAWARWLMRRLETYRVPTRLVGQDGIDGPIPARLGAFFRDRDELTASGNLGATIRAALADSEALIVVCSPAAAASRWVGAEVQAFRNSGRGDRILAFVVAGEPGQSVGEQACFPAALIAPAADGEPVEPLAADARNVADGRDRAFLKLVAGLLGVGYDDLAQREAQRKQRRLMQVAVASLAGMTLALGLAATAYVARNDAQRRQAQAEDILGFMLGDLRGKLAKVGRLELMRAVDDKAIGYFASLKPRDLSNRALEEQARSLTGIGQVRLEEGNHGEATAAFREAHARSTALLAREPDNGQRLFDLAQAEYWIGFVAFQQGRYDDASVWLTKYRDSAIRLAAMDRSNFDWQKEVAYGHQNLAALDESRGHDASAERAMQAYLQLLRGWIQQRPTDLELRFEAADAVSWLGGLALKQGRLADADAYFVEQNNAMRRIVHEDAQDPRWKQERINALLLLADVQAQQGRVAEARTSIEAAEPIAATLTAQDPANIPWRVSLGRCRWWQAQLDAVQRASGAEETAEAANRLLSTANAAEPTNENTLRWLLRARNLQAQLALERGDVPPARRHLAAAQALIEPAWRAAQNEALRMWMAKTRLLQGEAAQAQGDTAAASAAWNEARTLLLADASAGLPFSRLDPLVRVLLHLGQADQAAKHRQRLETAGYRPLHPWPTPQEIAMR